MLSEGNQIHNFISSSGSGTVINYGSGFGSDFLTSYGSGSGSTRQKFTVPTVPVPVPQHWYEDDLWDVVRILHFLLWRFLKVTGDEVPAFSHLQHASDFSSISLTFPLYWKLIPSWGEWIKCSWNWGGPYLVDWVSFSPVLWNRIDLLRLGFRFRFLLWKSVGSGSGPVPAPVPVPDPDLFSTIFNNKNCTKSCLLNAKSSIFSQKVGL